MILLPHDNNTGFIEPEILKPYGLYSLWERLKMGGIGSCKVYYKAGIPEFDKVIAEKTDLPIINFEIMRFALLTKLSISQECYTLATPKSSITKIFFDDIKSLTTGEQINNLHIFTNPQIGNGMIFEFLSGQRGSITSFFRKNYFSSFLAKP